MGLYNFTILSRTTSTVGGLQRDRFVIDALYNGQPLNWHPNQTGADDYPGISNRTNFDWIASGGSDFRSRFWKILLRRARKARAAQVQGKKVSDVQDSEVETAVIADPVNLSLVSLALVDTLLGVSATVVAGPA